MGYFGYGGWAPYVPVAERRKKGEKEAAKALKGGTKYAPVAAFRGAIAKSFWGRAWCDNLESYSDYANRMPRGRTYVRNGSVLDLQMTQGLVRAKVMGSCLYDVEVRVSPVAALKWEAIGKDCAASIDTLVELLQGKLSGAVMQRICMPKTGLFPAPAQIDFQCSCPDYSIMCKHVAAALYGVGARLDAQPELLFVLRNVNAQDLVAQAGSGVAGAGKLAKTPAKGKVLDNTLLGDVFGIELDVGPEEVASPERTLPVEKVGKKLTNTVIKAVTKPSVKKPTKKTAKTLPVAKKVALAGKPKATKLKATKPKATKPKATKPKATKPKATKPKATKPVAAKKSAPTKKPVAAKKAAGKTTR